MNEMHTFIAGAPHRVGARERIAKLLIETELKLVREPANPYDNNAVAVFDGDFQLGYVPAIDARTVSKAIDRGYLVKSYYTGHPHSTSISITWEKQNVQS